MGIAGVGGGVSRWRETIFAADGGHGRAGAGRPKLPDVVVGAARAVFFGLGSRLVMYICSRSCHFLGLPKKIDAKFTSRAAVGAVFWVQKT